MGLFDDIKQAISLSNSEQPVKTFKATLPEIIVTRNTKPSTWFGAQPTTTVTMAKPKEKKPKSSWRWTTVSNPRMRQFTGNSVAQPILTGLGYVADATNKAISGLATSNTTPTGIYQVQTPQQAQANQQIRQEVENTLNEKVWPTLMPTNYLTALFSEGSLNPYRGAEIKSTWSPTQQLLTVPVDIWTSKKVGQGVSKVVQNAIKAKKFYDSAGRMQNMSQAKPIVKNVFENSNNPYNWRNYRFLGDLRFYSDLKNLGPDAILYERSTGNYPLTFAERRKYVTDFKNDVQSGIDYAKQEAVENLKAPLLTSGDKWVEDPQTHIWSEVPQHPSDLKMQTPHFGTLKAIKTDGETPWEGNYAAFQNRLGLFFPFRNRPNTLRTHTSLNSTARRRGVGAHEARHTIQDQFETPLTEVRNLRENAYNNYTYRFLPLEFKKKVNSFIDDAQTAGDWAGSLSEMDAELTNWGAQYGFPSKYSKMTPRQKALVYDLFQRRFGGTTDYKLYNDVHGILNSPDIQPKSQFELNIDNSKIGEILQGLENLGYRKQGGKL